MCTEKCGKLNINFRKHQNDLKRYINNWETQNEKISAKKKFKINNIPESPRTDLSQFQEPCKSENIF